MSANNINLDEVKFSFSQESNCMSDNDFEILEVTAKSDLGSIQNGNYFFVIKTEEWAFDSTDDLKEIIGRIENSIKNFEIEKKQKK